MDYGLPSPLLDPLCWSCKNEKVRKKKNSCVTLGLSSTGSYKRVKVGEAKKLKVENFSLVGCVGECTPTLRGNYWGYASITYYCGEKNLKTESLMTRYF